MCRRINTFLLRARGIVPQRLLLVAVLICFVVYSFFACSRQFFTVVDGYLLVEPIRDNLLPCPRVDRKDGAK